MIKKNFIIRLFVLFFVTFVYTHSVLGCFAINIDRVWDYTLIIQPLLTACIDTLLVMALSCCMFWWNKKLFLWFSLAITLILSISNVIYGRLFDQYMLPDVWKEFVTRAGEGLFSQYIGEVFSITDLIFVIAIVVALFLSQTINGKIAKTTILRIICAVVMVVSSQFFWTSLDTFVRVGLSNSWYYGFMNTKQLLAWQPKEVYRKYGIIATNCIYLSQSKRSDLSVDELSSIHTYISTISKSNIESQPDLQGIDYGKNLVFIIVESYLSYTSDLNFGNSEITPNLNMIRHGENTYYNDSVRSNISIGESGDGQFIYMTGLLPLRDSYTISTAVNNSYYGFPQLLKESGYSTMITIPSKPDSWRQSEMSKIYGIDMINSSVDLGVTQGYLLDKQVFDLAIDKEKELKNPFLHVVLTVNMHSPYIQPDSLLRGEIQRNPSLSNDKLASYLSKCMSTDKEIGRYIETLKERDIYDNTVIVIVSDHQAHSNYLDVKPEEIKSEYLPLFIVNSGVPVDSLYSGEINQLDVYPTILSMFGLTQNNEGRCWTGLGNSLYNLKPLSNSVNDLSWSISSQMTKGNYFGLIN